MFAPDNKKCIGTFLSHQLWYVHFIKCKQFEVKKKQKPQGCHPGQN